MSNAKKAPDGSGSVRQRPDGRWEGRYTYIDPRTGRTCRGSVYGKTKKEASEKLRAKTAEIDKGTFAPDSSMTLEQWAKVYVEDYLAPQSQSGDKSNGTEKSYRGILKNHILPTLGKKRLKDITALDVQRFLMNLENKSHPGEPLSAKTVTNIHGTLHAIFAQAVANDFLQRNPADKARLKLPKQQKKPPRSLTNAELTHFLQAIQGHRYELLYLFDLFTGLREGEILGLSWSCVDWENQSIVVQSQLQYMGSGKGYRFVETKSHNARRVVVSADVLDLLRRRRAQQEHDRDIAGEAWDNPHDLVFTDAVGHFVRPSDPYRNLKRILKGIGIHDVCFHDLRHSYATLSIRAGNDVKTVQDNMGHYSSAFTLDVYVSAHDEAKRAGADNLSEYIQTTVLAAKGSELGSTAEKSSNGETISA